MGRRVLIVLTSHSELGSTGRPTGWYLPEVAHPYRVFKGSGFTCDFLSPKGGKAPMDPGSADAFKEDMVCNQFLADKAAMGLIASTKTPSQVSASDYDAIFYAGGHGPMYDLPNNKDIASLAVQVYEKGGVLSAVCHGTVGLVPVTLTSGKSVVKGQPVTCFTDSEEAAVGLLVPFLLETRLKELGANFSAAGDWQCHVVEGDRIITGQNPASATATAEAVVKALS